MPCTSLSCCSWMPVRLLLYQSNRLLINMFQCQFTCICPSSIELVVQFDLLGKSIIRSGWTLYLAIVVAKSMISNCCFNCFLVKQKSFWFSSLLFPSISSHASFSPVPNSPKIIFQTPISSFCQIVIFFSLLVHSSCAPMKLQMGITCHMN